MTGVLLTIPAVVIVSQILHCELFLPAIGNPCGPSVSGIKKISKKANEGLCVFVCAICVMGRVRSKLANIVKPFADFRGYFSLGKKVFNFLKYGFPSSAQIVQTNVYDSTTRCYDDRWAFATCKEVLCISKWQFDRIRPTFMGDRIRTGRIAFDGIVGQLKTPNVRSFSNCDFVVEVDQPFKWHGHHYGTSASWTGCDSGDLDNLAPDIISGFSVSVWNADAVFQGNAICFRDLSRHTFRIDRRSFELHQATQVKVPSFSAMAALLECCQHFSSRGELT